MSVVDRQPRAPEDALVVVTGPTATGKTELALQLAGLLAPAEIISADSRQVYRHMDIGTAKPTVEQRSRIPHHLIDVRDPDESFSAGEYARQARAIVAHLWRRGVTPVVVGGSGFYLQALLDGLPPAPTPQPAVRAALAHRLATEGPSPLHQDLRRLDPAAWSRTDPRDHRRLLRALELAARSGLRGTGLDGALGGVWLLFCLHMPRPLLYDRIGARVEAMLHGGALVAEVERLRDLGYDRACSAIGPMGYLEVYDHLDGRCSLAAAADAIKKSTRAYARRQLTWLRRDRRLRWLDVAAWGERGVLARMSAQLRMDVGREDGRPFFPVDS